MPLLAPSLVPASFTDTNTTTETNPPDSTSIEPVFVTVFVVVTILIPTLVAVLWISFWRRRDQRRHAHSSAGGGYSNNNTDDDDDEDSSGIDSETWTASTAPSRTSSRPGQTRTWTWVHRLHLRWRTRDGERGRAGHDQDIRQRQENGAAVSMRGGVGGLTQHRIFRVDRRDSAVPPPREEVLERAGKRGAEGASASASVAAPASTDREGKSEAAVTVVERERDGQRRGGTMATIREEQHVHLYVNPPPLPRGAVVER